MTNSEEVLNGLEMLLYCNETRCEECMFRIKEPCKPSSCRLNDEEVLKSAMALIKRQQAQIEALQKTAQNMMEGMVVFRG